MAYDIPSTASPTSWIVLPCQRGRACRCVSRIRVLALGPLSVLLCTAFCLEDARLQVFRNRDGGTDMQELGAWSTCDASCQRYLPTDY